MPKESASSVMPKESAESPLSKSSLNSKGSVTFADKLQEQTSYFKVENSTPDGKMSN